MSQGKPIIAFSENCPYCGQAIARTEAEAVQVSVTSADHAPLGSPDDHAEITAFVAHMRCFMSSIPESRRASSADWPTD